jgi:2-C-methyl-D-erythritol 2,4-cyclodiphosphate synthase
VRVGTGYDSHRFHEGRPLILGGVTIPDHPGLSGHSDGDAVAHAVIDAILGAAAAGDVGSHFPPGDARWKDADSIGLLERAVGVLQERGRRVVNVDVTVVCERPRIGPHAGAMRDRLATALRVEPTAVSVKGKTNEGMGWIGRGEGLAVHAVALIE